MFEILIIFVHNILKIIDRFEKILYFFMRSTEKEEKVLNTSL